MGQNQCFCGTHVVPAKAKHDRPTKWSLWHFAQLVPQNLEVLALLSDKCWRRLYERILKSYFNVCTIYPIWKLATTFLHGEFVHVNIPYFRQILLIKVEHNWEKAIKSRISESIWSIIGQFLHCKSVNVETRYAGGPCAYMLLLHKIVCSR